MRTWSPEDSTIPVVMTRILLARWCHCCPGTHVSMRPCSYGIVLTLSSFMNLFRNLSTSSLSTAGGHTSQHCPSSPVRSPEFGDLQFEPETISSSTGFDTFCRRRASYRAALLGSASSKAWAPKAGVAMLGICETCRPVPKLGASQKLCAIFK